MEILKLDWLDILILKQQKSDKQNKQKFVWQIFIIWRENCKNVVNFKIGH